jgi:antitoxin (DNA-binding transcriptional repressor) of toxin-antitoxin stability system
MKKAYNGSAQRANKKAHSLAIATPCRSVRLYNASMAKNVIHISESEAANEFASLMMRVRAGAEIVIEKDARPVAILHAAEPLRRTISECIALLPEDSTATIDPDFAKDVAAAVESQREPLSTPEWD